MHIVRSHDLVLNSPLPEDLLKIWPKLYWSVLISRNKSLQPESPLDPPHYTNGFRKLGDLIYPPRINTEIDGREFSFNKWMQERTTFFSGCSMARSFISSIVLCCLIALLLLVCSSPVFFFAAPNISSSMLLRFNNLFELELIWYGGNWRRLLVN